MSDKDYQKIYLQASKVYASAVTCYRELIKHSDVLEKDQLKAAQIAIEKAKAKCSIIKTKAKLQQKASTDPPKVISIKIDPKVTKIGKYSYLKETKDAGLTEFTMVIQVENLVKGNIIDIKSHHVHSQAINIKGERIAPYKKRNINKEKEITITQIQTAQQGKKKKNIVEITIRFKIPSEIPKSKGDQLKNTIFIEIESSTNSLFSFIRHIFTAVKKEAPVKKGCDQLLPNGQLVNGLGYKEYSLDLLFDYNADGSIKNSKNLFDLYASGGKSFDTKTHLSVWCFIHLAGWNTKSGKLDERHIGYIADCIRLTNRPKHAFTFHDGAECLDLQPINISKLKRDQLKQFKIKVPIPHPEYK